MLLDLAVQRDGSLYGNSVWRFQARPDPRQQQQVPQQEQQLEGEEQTKGGQAGPVELPYHRFAHRDALLMAMLVGQDAMGSPIFVSTAAKMPEIGCASMLPAAICSIGTFL